MSPGALPACDCLDLDSNFLPLRGLGPSQPGSQQMRIDRQCRHVSRLIEKLLSARRKDSLSLSDPIRPPAWPSRLFDISRLIQPKANVHRHALAHAAPGPFGPMGRGRCLG